MSKTKVLIVDDEKSILEILGIVLEDAGYDVYTAGSGKEALTRLQRSVIDILVVDYRMPEMNGTMLMEEALKIDPSIITIIMTAYREIKPAVSSLKKGAFDFIEKSFSNEDLLAALSRASEQRKATQKQTDYNKIKELARSKGIVAESKEMQRLISTACRIADTEASVLILGESGTGKEILANLIHRLSARKEKPFIALNCAAIPENLIEAELFGYEKGSFTGAYKTKRGEFELADGGTLFLDEVGEMPMQLQKKLLRAVQEKKITRIGGEESIDIDIRIISATNRNLEAAILEKTFREDLFYRLNVISMYIPPLRERPQDIAGLSRYFLTLLSKAYGRSIKDISFQAMDFLMHSPWPGNVRELRNAVERAVAMSSAECTELQLQDFRQFLSARDEHYSSSPLTLQESEKMLISNALRRNNYNKLATAKELDISRQTLYSKMKTLNIRIEDLEQ